MLQPLRPHLKRQKEQCFPKVERQPQRQSAFARLAASQFTSETNSVEVAESQYEAQVKAETC